MVGDGAKSLIETDPIIFAHFGDIYTCTMLYVYYILLYNSMSLTCESLNRRGLHSFVGGAFRWTSKRGSGMS